MSWRVTSWTVAVALILTSMSAAFGQADDSYRTLVDAVASPIYLVDNFIVNGKPRDSHSDNVLMVRLEMARQRLEAMKDVPSDLESMRTDAIHSLDICHMSLRRQRELDQSMPDIEGLAMKTIEASPGLYKVYKKDTDNLTDDESAALANLAIKAAGELITQVSNAYEAAEERTRYREAYRTLRAAARNALLKIVARRYENVSAAESDVLTVDLEGSFNAYYSADRLLLRNTSGKDLTNCTLFVDLDGQQRGEAASDHHVHFIAFWPQDKWVIARYPSTTHEGIATNESVDLVEKVEILVYADQVRDSITYQYSGDNYDADLKEYLAKAQPSFYGSWYRYDTNVFVNDGFDCHFTSVDDVGLPAHEVTVTAINGEQRLSLTWTLNNEVFLNGESNHKYFSDEQFNKISPTDVELIVRFPGSEVTHTVNWTNITPRN